MPSRTAEFILAIGIMALAAWAAISAYGWPLKAALFPLVISIPLLLLATAELAWLILAPPKHVQTKDFQPPQADVSPSLAGPRILRMVAWIVGFFVTLVLLGFPIAVALFVFLYLKLEARESWLYAALFTAVVWGAFYGLFIALLHLPFAAGVLTSWL
jgi:Tripartite tricarboxylate transporter TctB family